MSRVLVVEDERILALSLKSELTRRGYEVVGVAVNCDQAVEMAGTLQPDVVVMDISLSGKGTGIDAAEKIATLQDTPIVYLTGEGDMQTRQRAEAVPSCCGYLQKPLQINLLADLLARHVPARPVER